MLHLILNRTHDSNEMSLVPCHGTRCVPISQGIRFVDIPSVFLGNLSVPILFFLEIAALFVFDSEYPSCSCIFSRRSTKLKTSLSTQYLYSCYFASQIVCGVLGPFVLMLLAVHEISFLRSDFFFGSRLASSQNISSSPSTPSGTSTCTSKVVGHLIEVR